MLISWTQIQTFWHSDFVPERSFSISWFWKKVSRRQQSMKKIHSMQTLSVFFFSVQWETILNLGLLGNFSCFLSSADCFQNHFFENLFQKCLWSVKQFRSRSRSTYCQAWSRSERFCKVYQQTTIGGIDLIMDITFHFAL